MNLQPRDIRTIRRLAHQARIDGRPVEVDPGIVVGLCDAAERGRNDSARARAFMQIAIDRVDEAIAMIPRGDT